MAMVPWVHLGGTGRRELEAQAERAADALTRAMSALEEAWPHARDYYPAGPDVYAKAAAEAMARMRAVRGVRDEMQAILQAIVDGQTTTEGSDR